MGTQKEAITRALLSIGACWYLHDKKFLGANDPHGSRESYHVHPDASYPHEKNILRFDSLDEIAGYVRARKAAARVNQEKAYEIMQDFFYSLS